MSSRPLVSVIIPTYNRSDLVCEAVDNVLKQTYTNIEIIVVDDGSTDDTQSNLKRFGDKLRVLAKENAGVSAARNRGASIAKGEILAFQDSDDLWKPTKLERQVTLLEKFGQSVPCCLCDTTLHLRNGEVKSAFGVALIDFKYEEGIWLNVAPVLATRFVLFNQAVAVRREAFDKVGGFDEGLRYLEDWDLGLRLALEGPWAFIREPLTIHRQVSSSSLSLQSQDDEVYFKELEVRIFGRALARVKDGDLYSDVRRQLKRRLSVFRRGLVAAKLEKMGSFGTRTVGTLLRQLDHYGMGIFRRSPWFPRVRAVSVECSKSRSTAISQR